MKHALVVYESMFGNTEAVATAVADGLRTGGTATALDVGEAPTTVSDDIDLLVVGGPTHALSMSRPSTRRSASEQGADPERADHEGIREWIARLHVPRGLATATFDTKVVRPHLPGSAARAASRRLRRRGLQGVCDPQTFFVMGTSGDLLEGELERAREWGRQLAGRT